MVTNMTNNENRLLWGSHEMVGRQVVRVNSGYCSGRQGQVLMVDGARVWVLWTKETTGAPLKVRTWVNLKYLQLCDPVALDHGK